MVIKSKILRKRRHFWLPTQDTITGNRGNGGNCNRTQSPVATFGFRQVQTATEHSR